MKMTMTMTRKKKKKTTLIEQLLRHYYQGGNCAPKSLELYSRFIGN
jgi:hypothetical protein